MGVACAFGMVGKMPSNSRRLAVTDIATAAMIAANARQMLRQGTGGPTGTASVTIAGLLAWRSSSRVVTAGLIGAVAMLLALGTS